MWKTRHETSADIRIFFLQRTASGRLADLGERVVELRLELDGAVVDVSGGGQLRGGTGRQLTEWSMNSAQQSLTQPSTRLSSHNSEQ